MRFHRTLAAIALCAATCGGAQEGKYANSGNREAAVLPGVGLILIARGAALRDSAVVGREENLLYVLAVCPGLEGGSTGGGSNVGRVTSEYWYRWSTSAGEISLAFSWNRVTDTVHIADREYDRGRGNTFVVRRDAATGAWSAHQLSSIGPQLGPPDALRQIQSQLSDDPVISSLAIYPGA
jgi:hypothetical protein